MIIFKLKGDNRTRPLKKKKKKKTVRIPNQRLVSQVNTLEDLMVVVVTSDSVLVHPRQPTPSSTPSSCGHLSGNA